MPKGMKAVADSSVRGMQSIADAVGYVVPRNSSLGGDGDAVFFVHPANAGGRHASVAPNVRGPEEG